MISKIIQKEKELQEEYSSATFTATDMEIQDMQRETHKQSLINLKEYLEEAVKKIEDLTDWIDVSGEDGPKTGEKKIEKIQMGFDYTERLKEDIAELTKMIGIYE